MQHISPRDLKSWLDDSSRPQPMLLDVRESWEVALCALDGAHNIPMQQVPGAVGELPTDREIVILCHHGMRSMQVAMFLERQGIDRVHNLLGGINQWAADVAPDMPTY